jgi:hypothetical protein
MNMKSTCTQKFLLLVSLLLLIGTSNRLQATTYAWNMATGSAAWDLNADWTPTGYPNAAGDVANITKTITGTTSVILGSA